jgi:tRNA(Ile2) C34 agmatinyltransferase TiaS
VSYICPDCGSEVVTNGRCFVCYFCGCEGCGVGNLEVKRDVEPQPRGSADSPRKEVVR